MSVATNTRSHCSPSMSLSPPPSPPFQPQVDLYAWENPDFLSIFAAGNDGGKAKPGTMATPAGASRNGARGCHE